MAHILQACPPWDGAEPGDDLSIGLHLDVNGGFPHCVCSVILYLNEAVGDWRAAAILGHKE